MIAQFKSDCRKCRKAIEAGTSIYYTKEDGPHHWDCWENQPCSEWQVKLAEELGFRPFDRSKRKKTGEP